MHSVALDIDKSSVSKRVDDNGREYYDAFGLECYESKFNQLTGRLESYYCPRKRDKGLCVHRQDIDGNDIFHIKEFLGWKYCTDTVKELIEEKEYNNVRFLEVGDAI